MKHLKVNGNGMLAIETSKNKQINYQETLKNEQKGKGDQFEIVRFEKDGISLDLNVSPSEKTIWMPLNDMAIFFDRDRSVISRHVKKIFENETLDKESNVHFLHIPNSDKPVPFYRLDVVTWVGYRLKSNKAAILADFLNDYLHNKDKKREDSIVIFENGTVSLPVHVSPLENTVWISKEGLVSLFATTRQNIEYHIANIYDQCELDGATCKEILQVQIKNGKKINQVNKLYNLDMVISLGFRINTKNGITFRKWANNVLKEYLLKGYAINEARTLVTDENYVNLINRVDSIDLRVSKIESDRRACDNRVFFDGQFFEARSFLKGIFSKSEKHILLVDPYADILALDYLKEKKDRVKVTVVASSKSKLTKDDAAAFDSQFGPLEVVIDDSFHDRFIILDESELYHVGASLNHVGKKIFGISRIEDDDYLGSLLKKLGLNSL